MQMKIESSLAAHFKQANGTSLPGVSWLVRIEHGQQPCYARVKALLAANASRATRHDTNYQARTTMQYLAELIESGWNPAEAREHTIVISDPLGDTPSAPPRPWWRFW